MILLAADAQQAAEARRQLLTVGLDQVAGWIAGGFDAWTAAGLPVSRTPLARCGRAPSNGRAGGPDDRGRPQPRASTTRDHVPGALHIPLQELPSRLDALRRRRPIATMCEGGARSAWRPACWNAPASRMCRTSTAAWPRWRVHRKPGGQTDDPFRQAPGSRSTNRRPQSGRAGWAWSIAPATPGSAATSRSRSWRRHIAADPDDALALRDRSAGGRGAVPSRHPLDLRAGGRRRDPGRGDGAARRAQRCASGSAAGAAALAGSRARSAPRSPTGWPRRTPRGSSTATSSRRTSS